MLTYTEPYFQLMGFMNTTTKNYTYNKQRFINSMLGKTQGYKYQKC